jgi:hypothetical protein
MIRGDYWSNLCSTTSCEEFVKQHRYFFLLKRGHIDLAQKRGATIAVPALRSAELAAGEDEEPPTTSPDLSPELTRALLEPALMVLPVRKVQSTFPDMITVGRTANNDIVLADMSVSKFHAFFAVEGATGHAVRRRLAQRHLARRRAAPGARHAGARRQRQPDHLRPGAV